mgnify:CR=1 FL=1
MNLISEVEKHQQLFELKETKTSESFKQMLFRLNHEDAKNVHLEFSNHIDASKTIHSSRFSLVANRTNVHLIESMLDFISIHVPAEERSLLTQEAEKWSQETLCLAGFDEREDHVRYKIYASFEKNNEFREHIETNFPEAYPLLRFFSSTGRGYDFCVDKKSGQTKTTSKFYFTSPNVLITKSHRRRFRKCFSRQTIDLVEQSVRTFGSFRSNSDNLNVQIAPKDMSKFLDNDIFSATQIKELRQKYNSIDRDLWSISFLDNEVKLGTLNYVNTYCTVRADSNLED